MGRQRSRYLETFTAIRRLAPTIDPTPRRSWVGSCLQGGPRIARGWNSGPAPPARPSRLLMPAAPYRPHQQAMPGHHGAHQRHFGSAGRIGGGAEAETGPALAGATLPMPSTSGPPERQPGAQIGGGHTGHHRGRTSWGMEDGSPSRATDPLRSRRPIQPRQGSRGQQGLGRERLKGRARSAAAWDDTAEPVGLSGRVSLHGGAAATPRHPMRGHGGVWMGAPRKIPVPTPAIRAIRLQFVSSAGASLVRHD